MLTARVHNPGHEMEALTVARLITAAKDVPVGIFVLDCLLVGITAAWYCIKEPFKIWVRESKGHIIGGLNV